MKYDDRIGSGVSILTLAGAILVVICSGAEFGSVVWIVVRELVIFADKDYVPNWQSTCCFWSACLLMLVMVMEMVWPWDRRVLVGRHVLNVSLTVFGGFLIWAQRVVVVPLIVFWVVISLYGIGSILVFFLAMIAGRIQPPSDGAEV